MANKTYDVRLLLRNGTDAAWEAVKASFKPLKGEVVLHEGGKYKIGDGEHFLKDLPFYYGDKDTDTKYEFSTSDTKPGVITVQAKDKDGNAVGQAVDVTVPGMAKASDLDSLEDRVDALEAKVERPMNFKGAYDSIEAADAALAPEGEDDTRENGDFILVGTKEYVWYKADGAEAGDWKEVGDESAYVEKEAGKGLSENDFTDELKEKLEGIAAGATATEAVTIDSSSLLSTGETVAKITIGSTEYTIKAPQAGESKTYYLSNLEGTKPAEFDGEVVMDGGSVPA